MAKVIESNILNYLSSGGDVDLVKSDEWRIEHSWTAAWSGNDFFHTSGPRTPGSPHPAPIIRYHGHEGQLWTATWDPTAYEFVHTRGGETRRSKLINYVTWDGSLWSATRNGDSFVHVFVENAPEGQHLLKTIEKFYNSHKELVDALLALAAA